MEELDKIESIKQDIQSMEDLIELRKNLIKSKVPIEYSIINIKKQLQAKQDDLKLHNSKLIEVEEELQRLFKKRKLKSKGGITLSIRKAYQYNDEAIIQAYPEFTRVKVELDKIGLRASLPTLIDQGLVTEQETYYFLNTKDNKTKVR